MLGRENDEPLIFDCVQFAQPKLPEPSRTKSKARVGQLGQFKFISVESLDFFFCFQYHLLSFFFSLADNVEGKRSVDEF